MKEDSQIYKYNGATVEVTNCTVDYVAENLNVDQLDRDYTHWINFHDLSNRTTIEGFCNRQSYDRLVLDDIYTYGKRPKLEDYGSYLFFSIRSALPGAHDTMSLQQEQIGFILGSNYLISLQEKKSDHFTEVRDRIENKKGIVRDKGADFLLYRMLDAIVDNYFEVVENASDVIESLDALVTKTSNPRILNRIEMQKRRLIELRKIVMPLKEITVLLENSKSDLISHNNHHYFVDLRGNCMSILDEIDSNKNALDGLANLYYAVQGQRMNEIMSVLTVVSTIFIPLTFIVGVYGMNFKHMPELDAPNGYLIVWIVMVVIAVSLLLLFLKRGWLRRK